MTKSFLTSWGSDAGCLKQVNQQLNAFHPIVEVFDNLSLGVLADADQPAPNQRISWWQDLWAAQWWHQQGRDEVLYHYEKCQQQLLSTLVAPDPVVVWIGNRAHDKLMLAMVAHLAAPNTPLAVIDITGQVERQHQGQYAVGICEPEALLGLKPIPLTDSARTDLAHQWCDWKTRGKGWRETDMDGQVIEYPLNHWDVRLLDRLTTQPQKIMRVVGEVMGLYHGTVPDGFLVWRLACLRQAGLVAFLPDDGSEAQVPKVMLA